MSGWCASFPSGHGSLIQRTEQFLYEERNERPTQIENYITIDRDFNHFQWVFIASLFSLLTKFGCGRSLLEAHPKFFSLGTVTKSGPTREMIKKIYLFTEIFGKGWDKNSSVEPRSSPNKMIGIKVTSNLSSYLTTSTCLVQSSLTLLNYLNKMPKRFVYQDLASLDVSYMN